MPPARVGRRAALLAGVLAWGLFQNLYRLGAADWAGDELTYRFTGLGYVHGDFSGNQDHPFTGKLLLGLGQLLLGPSQTANRVVPAVASLVTGALVYLLLCREAGFPAAVAGLATWLVLPHSAAGLPVRIDRFGLLEPLVTLFAFATLYAGWRWLRTGAWWPALLTGVLAGLALTTKVVGLLVVPGVLVAVVLTRRCARTWSQLLGCVIAIQLVATMSYAIAGARGADAARYMLDKQSAHNSAGHLVQVAGADYLHPPWWSHLWFQTQSYGVVGIAAIVVLALVGVALPGHRRLAGYLSAGVAVPLLTLSIGVDVALPFYYLLWQPALAALVGVGAGALWSRRTFCRLAAVTAAAPLLALAIATSGDVFALRHTSYDLIPTTPLVEVTAQRTDVVLVLGVRDRVAVWIAGQPVVTRIPRGRRIGAVVIDCAFARRYPRDEILRYVAATPDLVPVAQVDGLIVYMRARVGRPAAPVVRCGRG